ncbi:hypothetical protein MSSIH_2379 [Methanosarcina siciliae HI350]|uniref:Glycosyltransferase RgtA/B/C/D-like domain-containing protein n=1 Tax=Methanosarcina siciliae HI350 TaxID=1434119 RepID=A0A0E3PFE6_9EURY|nr:hypothetical protein [Methanosarcina siciliae]AKB33069.1 hypothetical protein MSSIH_2379 [Methanosarcina siciliae HI350]
MKPIPFKVDVTSAILVACVCLVASVIVFKVNFQLGFAPFSALIACIFYLIHGYSKNVEGHSNYITCNTVSCNLFILLIYLFLLITGLILVLNYSLYNRTLLYFITLSISGGLIFFCTAYLNINKFQKYSILFAIFIISIHLYIIPQFLYTDLIGIDPWKHESFVTSSIQSSHFVEGFAYSRMPGMHSLISMASLILDVNYKKATLISISFSQTISLIFIYLLSKNILNERIGMLATLLLAISSNKVSLGFWVQPTTFALIMATILLYLVFIGKDMLSVPNVILKLIVGFTLIVTHMQIALGMAIVFFVIHICTPFYASVYKRKEYILNFRFLFLFAVIMLSWWMYVSNHFILFVDILKQVIDFDPSGVAGTTVYARSSTNTEYVVDMSSYFLYYSLSVVGIFYSISKKSNISYFALSLSGVAIALIPFVLMLSHLGGLLGERWIYLSQVLMAIPAAVGVYLIFFSNKSYIGKFISVFLIILFIFANVVNPSANVDNPFDRDSFVRPAHTNSELVASYTLSRINNDEVFTDYIYQFPVLKYSSLNVNEIEPLLLNNNFSLIGNGLIVMRKEVLIRRTLKLPQRLSPEIVSTLSSFNRIYDNDAVVFYET